MAFARGLHGFVAARCTFPNEELVVPYKICYGNHGFEIWRENADIPDEIGESPYAIPLVIGGFAVFFDSPAVARRAVELVLDGDVNMWAQVDHMRAVEEAFAELAGEDISGYDLMIVYGSDPAVYRYVESLLLERDAASDLVRLWGGGVNAMLAVEHDLSVGAYAAMDCARTTCRGLKERAKAADYRCRYLDDSDACYESIDLEQEYQDCVIRCVEEKELRGELYPVLRDPNDIVALLYQHPYPVVVLRGCQILTQAPWLLPEKEFMMLRSLCS